MTVRRFDVVVAGGGLVGMAIAWGIAIVGTLIILKICDVLVGVRVPREHEIEGLDVTQHGEEGYSWETATR